jgi:integrase/recombinase XerC
MDALEAAAATRQHLKCRTEKHGLLGMRDEIIFLLCGLGGGLRISEVAGLDVDDINMSTCQIRVRGKGGTDQRIEVDDSVIDAIGKWLEVRPGSGTRALLTDWNGKRLTSGQLRRRLKMIGFSAKVELTPHDLRATFGCLYYSNAIRQTGSEYAAGDATRRQMRHKDFRTTQRNYLRASRAQIRAALKGL